MPRYFIFNEPLVRAALLADKNVSDPKSAIEAVPSTTELPERVLVVKASDIDVVQVVDSSQPSVDLIVERPAGV